MPFTPQGAHPFAAPRTARHAQRYVPRSTAHTEARWRCPSEKSLLGLASVLAAHVCTGTEVPLKSSDLHRTPSKLSEKTRALGPPLVTDIGKTASNVKARKRKSSSAVKIAIEGEVLGLLVAVTATMHLHYETLVNTLIIVERLLRRGFMLKIENVRPVVLTALLVAAKLCENKVSACAVPDPRIVSKRHTSSRGCHKRRVRKA